MKYLTALLILFFSACSMKNYEHSEAKIVTIKSPKIKFSDIGYVRHTDDAIELELFVAGHVFQRIHINSMICVEDGCMAKRSFNNEYLNAAYPADMLQNVILGRPIYAKQNLVKSKEGFVQNIVSKDVNIKYRVNAHSSFFKDKKNHIIIKIRDTNGK